MHNWLSLSLSLSLADSQMLCGYCAGLFGNRIQEWRRMRRYFGGILNLLLGFPFIVMHAHVALLLRSMGSVHGFGIVSRMVYLALSPPSSGFWSERSCCWRGEEERRDSWDSCKRLETLCDDCGLQELGGKFRPYAEITGVCPRCKQQIEWRRKYCSLTHYCYCWFFFLGFSELVLLIWVWEGRGVSLSCDLLRWGLLSLSCWFA